LSPARGLGTRVRARVGIPGAFPAVGKKNNPIVTQVMIGSFHSNSGLPGAGTINLFLILGAQPINYTKGKII